MGHGTYVQHPAYVHGDGGVATITARFWRMEAFMGANYCIVSLESRRGQTSRAVLKIRLLTARALV